MTTPGALRGILLVALVGALVLAISDDGPLPDGSALTIAEGADAETMARALSGAVPPAHVLRTSGKPPTLEESELFEVAATFAPLTIRGPETRPLLVPSRPERLVRGRSATLPFQLLGFPGERRAVRLEGEGGSVDSVIVTLDAEGVGEGFFRIRPARAGWYDWQIVVGPATPAEPAIAARRLPRREVPADLALIRLGAWVREAEPLRLLVLGGAPTWESRFLVRALEEEGMTVALHQSVAAGLEVNSELDRAPRTVDDFAAWDAVILLPGVPLGPQRLDAIEAYVVERGGGVAIAGAGEGSGGQGGEGVLFRLGLAAAAGPARAVPGNRLAWSLPPEIAPLPVEPLLLALSTFREPSDGAVVGVTLAAPLEAGGTPPGGAGAGSSADLGAVLLLGSRGRGRVAAVGLRETWRWRMEAGRMGEHRDFWRTLSEWLAGGLREEWRVVPARTHVPVGSTVSLRIVDHEGAGMTAAPKIVVAGPGPDGRREIVLDADGTARFIATEAGIHTISLGGDPPSVAISATSGGDPDPAGWAPLAHAAHASGGGGGVVDRDSALSLASAFGGGDGDGLRSWLPSILFLLLVILGIAEWTLRRLRGLS